MQFHIETRKCHKRVLGLVAEVQGEEQSLPTGISRKQAGRGPGFGGQSSCVHMEVRKGEQCERRHDGGELPYQEAAQVVVGKGRVGQRSE